MFASSIFRANKPSPNFSGRPRFTLAENAFRTEISFWRGPWRPSSCLAWVREG